MVRQSTGGGVGVDFDSTAFLGAFDKAVRNLPDLAEKDLLRLGTQVQNAARRLAPVDTGRLRSSIQRSGVQRDTRGRYVSIGTNVKYGAAVEFGTRNSRAQPYLRPALLAVVRGAGR